MRFVLEIELTLKGNQRSDTSTLYFKERQDHSRGIEGAADTVWTAMHVPIPHGSGRGHAHTNLESPTHGVVGEEFAVSNDGTKMFGVLDLETSFAGCRFASGIRM
jgi:hypothetical protein